MVDRTKLLSEDRVRLGPAVAEAWRAVLRRAGGIVVLTAALVLPLELLAAQLQADDPDVPVSGSLTGFDGLWAVVKLEFALGDLLVFLTALPLVAGVAAVVAAGAQAGRGPSVGRALAGVLPRLPRLLVLTVLVGAAIVAVGALGALVDLVAPDVLPTTSLGDVAAAMVLVVGWAALLPYALATFPVGAIEGGGPFGAVRRLLEVVHRHYVVWLGRAAAIFFGAALLASLARWIVLQILRTFEKGVLVEAVGEAIADLVFIPLVGAAAALTYLDVRARAEAAFDEEQLREDLPV